MTEAVTTTMTFHPRPADGAPTPWHFPAPERGTLDNGLTVLRCHRPGRHVVAVEVSLAAPLDAEPEGLEGVANIMACAFTEGTGSMTAQEFTAELERCGATLDIFADHPAVRLSLEVPARRLGKALGLLAQALRAPAFPDDEIARLVANRLDKIPYELAVPVRRANYTLCEALFPAASRLSRPRLGTAESVARVDAAAVRAFYRDHVRPATTTAVVVGDLTGIDLDALLADTLGAWTGKPAAPRPVPPAVTDDHARVVIVDRPGSVQTQLLSGRAGADRHDAIWPAQALGVYSLGGTLTSRLDRVLREEKGYTYGVRASAQVLRSAPDGSGVSLLTIGGSVATEVTGPALADTWQVLRTLAEDGLTDDERDGAVQNLVGVAPLRYETAAAVANTFADQVEQHLPDDFQARLYERLAATSTVEATAAAVDAFPPDRLVVVLVGDAAAIEKPVTELGLGPVSVVRG